jgi:hypothetical protein
MEVKYPAGVFEVFMHMFVRDSLPVCVFMCVKFQD